jgi:hypothetical protein
MSANKERQHYYDSLLHERVAGYFFEDGASQHQDLTPYYPFLAGVAVTISRLLTSNRDRVKRLLRIFQEFSPTVLNNSRIDNLLKLQYFLIIRRLEKDLKSNIDTSGESSSFLCAFARKRITSREYLLLFRDLVKPSSFDLLNLMKIVYGIVCMKSMYMQEKDGKQQLY